MASAIGNALKDLILENDIPLEDRVYFGLHSNRLANSLQYRGFKAGEWVQGGGRVNEMLNDLSRTLNSNENFKLDETFQLSFTHAKSPPEGRGRKRKLKPGHSEPRAFKARKESVIGIINKDNLCAARAIVTAKAKMDGHENWDGFRKGRKIQYEQAFLLHHEAGVPENVKACGYEELAKFAAAPSL